MPNSSTGECKLNYQISGKTNVHQMIWSHDIYLNSRALEYLTVR